MKRYPVGASACLLFALCAVPAAASAQQPARAAESAEAGSESLPLAPLEAITFSTSEGTWISLDVSPDGSLITFDLLGKIFALPITGGHARQLTFGPAWDERPRFSPDGRFVVFSSDRGGHVQLWRVPAWRVAAPTLMPLAAMASYPLAGEFVPASRELGDTSPLFLSPDGRYGVRSSRAPRRDLGGCQDSVAPHFVLVDRGTQTRRRLAPAGSDCGVGRMPQSAFTPDGSAFITSYGGKIWQIAVPSGETTEIPFRADVELQIRPLVRFPQRVSEDSLVHARRIEGAELSPDRSHVAFGALGRVWVMVLPDGKPRRLTSLDVGEYTPAWSPDGRHIAFVTWTDERGGEGHIWRARADGTEAPERLTLEAAHYSELTYSAEGRRLFAVARPTRAMRRSILHSEDSYVRLAGDGELVWIPATGGASVTVDLLNPAEWLTHARIHTRKDAPNVVLRYERQRLLTTSNAGALVAIRTDGTRPMLRAARDTVLKLAVPEPEATPFYFDEPEIHGIMLSPSGDRALVLADWRNLFLIDVPPKDTAGAPTVVLDPQSPHVRAVTRLASGGEFPRWHPDGRTFSYTFGNKLFIYDVPAADSVVQDSTIRTAAGGVHPGSAYVPVVVDIQVAEPRDLPTGMIAFRNARLITMRGDEVIERGDLLVRDRRIAALGPAGAISIPAGAHVIDAAGMTIIPGLVDLHNHIFPLTTVQRTRVSAFEANLAYGVLTSLDPQTFFTDFLTYEDRLATGALLGVRYMNTGRGIGTGGDRAGSLAEALQIVSRYADVYRVGYLKEYMIGGRDARQWLVMAAADRGLNVTSHGHIVLKNLLMNAIDGYSGFDHFFDTAPLYGDVRWLLARSGITLANSNVPFFERYFLETLDAAEWERLGRWYPPNAFDAVRRGALPSFPPAVRASYDDVWRMSATLARLVADGGRVAVGGHGDIPGFGTHLQLWAYAKGGMPALDVLRAGTLRGAEALGLDRDLGSLEVEKLADLLVLERNPLESIRNTTSIRYILFNGRLRDATTLDEVWPAPKPVPAPWWAERVSPTTPE